MMAILGVSNNISIFGNNPVSKPISANNSKIKHEQVSETKSYTNIPSSAYKANFMPSFGKFKKLKDVPMYNKETGMYENKTIMREVIGDYVMLKMMSGREEIGYLHMNCDSVFKEDKFLLPEPDNNIPEITHLRSLRGDKYYGIGTALIDTAVDESIRRGKGGALWCTTEQGYAHSLSAHRKNENPIPFYYKMGFKSPDFMIDALIKKSLDSGNLGLLPESTVLLLSSIDAEKFKKHYLNNISFEKKSA